MDIDTVPIKKSVLVAPISNPDEVEIRYFNEITLEEWRQIDEETKKLIKYKGAGCLLNRTPAKDLYKYWRPIPTPPKESE